MKSEQKHLYVIIRICVLPITAIFTTTSQTYIMCPPIVDLPASKKEKYKQMKIDPEKYNRQKIMNSYDDNQIIES